ncbi:MAG: hypothetical protein IPQ07_44225 [Myxococcales bacterium]|nr:hypothetical protein [Myxococcales bacterium]
MEIRPNPDLNVWPRYEEQRLRFAEFCAGKWIRSPGERHGKNAVKLTGELAPRPGHPLRPTREGRSKAYAHWGRFRESIPPEINYHTTGSWVQYLQSKPPSKCVTSDPADRWA